MSYSLKNIVEWSEEGSASRPRNLVLYSIVALYLFITLVFFFTSIWLAIPAVTVNLYYSLSAIFVSVVGFYTTTYPKNAKTLSQENQININNEQLKYFREVFDKILDKNSGK